MTIPRRFSVGEEGELLGLQYKVERGKKPCRRAGWEDLRLMWRVPFWRPVSMHWLYLGTDFLTENEDGLFPPEQNLKGGEYLMTELRRARETGWLHISQSLDVDITRRINEPYRESTG